ncbi:hypothetical protein R3P38DRAFT_2763120 [Favolaschia claudopus]|uniref:CxC2-like cysteine cluster KDZ transposase-associated domain-containing protein n=1 Tax=Favolaschia claudopus TaxID=2862362 RepID=A0AAW0DMB6_9AGAR
MTSTTPPPPPPPPAPQVPPAASAEQESFREAFRALGYEFTSTTRIAGLPSYIVENMLEYHREQYRDYGHSESGATGGDVAERRARIELSYDMTCHWFKNVYATEVMERPTSLDSAGSAAAAAAATTAAAAANDVPLSSTTPAAAANEVPPSSTTPAPTAATTEDAPLASATAAPAAASVGDVEDEVEEEVAHARRVFWLATHPSDLSDIIEGKAASIIESVLRAIRTEDADAMVGDDNDNSEDEMPPLIPIPTSDEEDQGHDLEIIGMGPTPQEVRCTCTDGKHLPYLRRQVFAFEAPDGTLLSTYYSRNISVDLAKNFFVAQKGKYLRFCLVAASTINKSFPAPLRLQVGRAGSLGRWRRNTTPRRRPEDLQNDFSALRLSPHPKLLLYLEMSARSTPTRSPNKARRDDSYIEYEERPEDSTQDSEFHSSQDGRRGVRKAVNIQRKQHSRAPNELDQLGGWTPLPEDANGAVEAEAETLGEKRKRYESSDDPMKVWRRLAPMFLDEMLRHEGPGDNAGSRHSVLHLHIIEEWKGNFWTRVSPASLGVVYQLGHGGYPCPHAAPAERSMVVLDFPHIHEIRFRYCACSLSDHANNLQQLLRNGWYPASTVDPATCATFATLDMFRLLNVVGDVTAHDFMRTTELMTDASGVSDVPDRHKILRLVSRQFGFLLRLKRAGRAHDAGGLEGTARGECAVRCWACPQEGINLPEGWREVGPEFHCAGFAALAQKETRLTTGLRASGVGAVICARHELLRPQGIGDLQKANGEYINMDYILLASLVGVTLLYLAIAYDIACQWRVNFQRRCTKFPPEMQLDFERTKVTYGPAGPGTLLLMSTGVGRTDGEVRERVWSDFNGASTAMKEMNYGAREDGFEDKVDRHNFEKNVRQGTTLPRKLVIAIDERDRQVPLSKEVDPGRRTEQRRIRINGKKRKETSGEAAIRLALAKEELEEAASNSRTTRIRIRGRSKVDRCLPTEHIERVTDMRRTFYVKLKRFRRLQAVYMPGAVEQLREAEEGRYSELPPPLAEDIALCLPSALVSPAAGDV